MLILMTVIASTALLIWLSQNLCRRVRLSAAGGLGIALTAIAIAILVVRPFWWSALVDSEPADRLLTASRQIGVTGLVFVAGTRLKLEFTSLLIRRAAVMIAMSLVLAATLAGCASSVLGFDRGETVVIAAAVVASSVWLPSENGVTEGGSSYSGASLFSSLLSGALFVTIHLAGTLSAGGGGAPSVFAIGLAYELVKLVVFFSLAWFVATRFISRAQGKVSEVRLTAAYLIIAILVFAIAASWLGELGAFGWSFVAGTLFRRTGAGRTLASRDYHSATSSFLAMAFLPVFLQSHGREAASLTIVSSSIAAALIAKALALWLSARLTGAATGDARRLTAAMIAPAETGVALIGFGMSKWLIGGTAYFIGLGFGVVALVASFRRIESAEGSKTPELHSGGEAQAKARATSLRSATLLLGALVLTLIGTRSAAAQTEDPVNRAMRTIEQAAARAEVDANRTLAAARLVEESAAARNKGDWKRANEILGEAERVGLPTAPEHRGPLADLLMDAINRERAQIQPVSPPSALRNSGGGGVQPASRARLAAYGEMIGSILRQENLPAELISVALVESGLNNDALSPKGARGVWQLMPATARRYGLAVEPGNDHRTELERSTRAAARYLGDLYRQFGDWKLVLAAYNWGEDRVLKAIQKAGSRDFDEITRRVFVPLETRRYVPTVLAAWSRLSGASEPDEGKAKGQRYGGSR